MHKAIERLRGAHRCSGLHSSTVHPDSPVQGHGFPSPQKCIDWNRELLKRELGLSESDIVDIPQLFFLKGAYAEAFFPDMVRAPGGGRTGGYGGCMERAQLGQQLLDGQVHALGLI